MTRLRIPQVAAGQGKISSPLFKSENIIDQRQPFDPLFSGFSAQNPPEPVFPGVGIAAATVLVR